MLYRMLTLESLEFYLFFELFMKTEQPVNTSPSETGQVQTEPISRREIMYSTLTVLAAGVFSAAAFRADKMQDRSASVDDIVNDPKGLTRYREVVCTGLVKGAGNAEVTTFVGGYPISSSAAASGSFAAPTEVKKTLPTYTLFGSTSDTSLTLVRDNNGFDELTAGLKTTNLEKELQAGEEALVKVSGHLSIRDGKQYLIFHSIKEITLGKDN